VGLLKGVRKRSEGIWVCRKKGEIIIWPKKTPSTKYLGDV